ncbi:MAG: GOLPH3/VPS74 family protein [Desulfonatronovibrionaceae bacterium]
MLNFAQEILLLTLDDEKKEFRKMPRETIQAVLAGSLLMELAFAHRIDTDLESLTVVDSTPTGDPLMDDILNRLQASDASRSTASWVMELSVEMQDLRDRVLNSLVQKGVLKIEDRKVLWVFSRRRYPLMDNKEIKEVRTRLRELIASGDIPDPREAVLIGLINSCGLLDSLFDEYELARHMPRVNQLAKLELMGRDVDRSVENIYQAMASHYRNRSIE